MRSLFCALVLILLLGCEDAQITLVPPNIDTSQLAPEAKVALQKAIKEVETTGSAQHWTTLGLYLQAHGLDADAVVSYEAATQLPNTPTKTAYWMALALAKLGKYEQAISLCSQYKNYAPAYWRSGFWFIDLGKIEAAEIQFNKALEVDKSAVAAMVGLARAWLQQNKPNQAVTILEEIRDRGGKHPYLHYLLGTAYQRSGDVEKAAPFLQEVVNGPPKWNDPWFDEMTTYQRGFAASISRASSKLDSGDVAGALHDLQLLARTNPRNAAVLTNLATVQMQLGQIEQAYKTCSDSIRWNPGHAPSQLNMALLLLQKGESDLASQYCQKAIALEPANARAHALAGKIAFQSRKVFEAATHFEQAIAIGSNNPNDREMLGMAYLDLGKNMHAIEQFRFVLRVSPDATFTIGGLVIALFKNGQVSESQTLLENSIAQFPNDPNLARASNFLSKQGVKR